MNDQAQYTLILGLGKTGLSCVDWLVGQGASIRVADSRPAPPELLALRERHPGIDPVLGEFSASLLEGVYRVVISPGIALDEPIVVAARSRGLPVIGDIELFGRDARAPIVAVTGSNGKSTVVSLLAHMCNKANCNVEVGGNLGTPALSLLMRPKPEFYLLELSSFQLDSIERLKLHAACVLNVSPDHMDRYASLGDYAASKARIYRDAGTVIVNRDDPLVETMVAAAVDVRRFGLGPADSNDWGLLMQAGEPWLAKGDHALLVAGELLLPGAHNQANALAALALGESMGLPVDAMLEALRDFAGLPHRSEFVAEHNGVRWYDDSKATNVGATVAALSGMPSQVVLIAGGQGKGQDFSPLGDAVKQHLRAAILLGEDAPQIEQVIKGSLNGAAVLERVESMDAAVEQAAKVAKSGDVVLLSPACASFDMFSGFEARGDAFAAAVRRLVA